MPQEIAKTIIQVGQQLVSLVEIKTVEEIHANSYSQNSYSQNILCTC